MKISLSSSSSSSSSTASLDRNLSNSENVTGKCFSSIIRRFFCTGNLRTHPFDCIKESNHEVQYDHNKKELKLEEKIQAPPTPGLVARLMGLESMPELDLIHKQRNAYSIGRSRSVNSVDFLSEFEPKHRQHRRVKTSLSLREMPTFLQLENDEFLLLSFENVDENKELGLKGRKSEMGCGELKQRRVDGSKNRESRGKEKRVPIKNKKDEKEDQERIKRDCNKKEKQERRKCGRPCREILENLEIKDLGLVHPQKEVFDKSKLAKKKKCRYVLKKVEPECKSENSSPVSVLDLDEFQIDHESSLSEEESRGKNSASRRKLNPDVVNLEYPSHEINHISSTGIPGSRSIHGQRTTDESTKLGSQAQEENHKEMWGEVFKLTEEDMKTSNWMLKEVQKMEELEEIGTEFGLEIIDQLLEEMVIEVSGFPMMDFAL